jgi:transposase
VAPAKSRLGTALLPATATQLSNQAFWNHMDRVDEPDIVALETQLSQRLVRDLKLDLRSLIHDGTNFFTYSNTRTACRVVSHS